jgi:hypothetical protein
VSGCNPFGQGINIRPRSDVRTTQSVKHKFLHLSQHLLFRRLRQFAYFPFTTSSLEFFESTSASSQVLHEHLLAVTSGFIAVVGTKVFELSPLSIVRSNRLARLNVESGISPLCLQSHFCTNTSFGTLGGTEIQHQDQHVEHQFRLGERHPRDGSQS